MENSLGGNSLQTKPERLASLDILRGLDLFFLVFFKPVLASLGKILNIPCLNTFLIQFQHEEWAGFRFWDLIMPLFLFMVGVAMPFSLEKYRNLDDKSALYKRIVKRVIILFILGMVVGGNLLSLEFHRFHFYSNTLQSIAVGYLFSAIILLNCKLRGQIIWAGILLLAYALPITFCGDFTPSGNFAEKLDRVLMGSFRDGVIWSEDGTWKFSEWYRYTWILSSLTFIVSVLFGCIAGTLIKNGNANRSKTALNLAIIGLCLVLAGWLWSFQMPIIKKIWTSSMTLLAGGYSFLLMAFFYYWIDCKKRTFGLEWLKIYGMNSILAYMLGMVINFRSIVNSVSYGLKPIFGEDYYAVWLTFGNALIIFFILHSLYKRKIFLKI